MVTVTRNMIEQLEMLMEASDNQIKIAFENMHQGYQIEIMTRFLKERDGNISEAHKMLVDCLKWRLRIPSCIDEKTSFYKSATDSQLEGIPGYTNDVRTVESMDRVIRNFETDNETGLPQFWVYIPSNSEDIGCILMLTKQTSRSTQDEGLEEYRRKCFENPYRYVGLDTSVGNWLPGRAAQTGIADHWTMHRVLKQEDQHSADIGGRGLLVLPVFYDLVAGNKFVGIVEFVTPVPKESYVEEFEQFQKLLKVEGLKSTYMGKTIKVKYDNNLIKFTLPLSAKFTNLQREVKLRYPELEHRGFRVEYDATEGNRLQISNDEDLSICMGESSSKGAQFIKMWVLLNT